MAVEACIIVHWIVGHTFYQFCLSELNLEGIQDLIRYPKGDGINEVFFPKS